MSGSIPTNSISPSSSGNFGTSTSAANIAANAAAAKGNSTVSGSSATSGLNSTYADFLKILTTELQNQDPTQPTDPSQFVGQLATLNQVQQQVNTNTTLTQVLAQLQASAGANASNLVGDNIIGPGNSLSLNNVSIPVAYTMPANIKSGTIVITDSSGKEVFSTPATTTVGQNTFTWDGRDATGKLLPDGTYKVAVSTVDKNGISGTAALASSSSLTVNSVKDTFGYTMPTNIKSGIINIKDSSGKVVFSAPATATAGNHTYQWNGADANGNKLANGAYTVSVSTLDNNGKAGTATTSEAAVVQAVDLSQATPQLILQDGSEIPVSSVISIQKPTTQTSSN